MSLFLSLSFCDVSPVAMFFKSGMEGGRESLIDKVTYRAVWEQLKNTQAKILEKKILMMICSTVHICIMHVPKLYEID